MMRLSNLLIDIRILLLPFFVSLIGDNPFTVCAIILIIRIPGIFLILLDLTGCVDQIFFAAISNLFQLGILICL